jgi:hypothetical protein
LNTESSTDKLGFVPTTVEISTALLQEAPTKPELRELRRERRADRVAQLVALTILLAGPAMLCLHMAFMSDCDIWWHLRTGEWILQHRAVPRTEPFSILAGTPWVAYSWAFEVIVYKLFHWFGLTGILAYSTGMILLITVALYRMVRHLQSDFTVAALLTFLPMYSMGHLSSPRPWLFTILFFLLEVDILISARRSGRKTGLLWLPLIFAVWANTHIQFVDGLFVLGLAFAESVLSRWWKGAQRGAGALPMGLALGGSIAGTLLNPYGWRLYAVAHDLATQSGALDKITELQAIPFRTIPDFTVLLLALGAVAALGWRRKLLSFEGALLAFAVVLSFRSQRDVWATAVVAAVVLASSIASTNRRSAKPTRAAFAVASLLAALIVSAGFRMWGISDQKLQSLLDNAFPVQAVHQLAAAGVTGPVYSDFNWGGYLIWNLRNPVMLDGRQNVYGDERMDRCVATWSGGPNWSSDPNLTSASAVIGPAQSPLVQLLRTDQRFRKIYEDKVASVFVPRH